MQNQPRVKAAVEFLVDFLKPSCDPRDPHGSRETLKTAIRRYVELNFDPPHENLTKTMTDAAFEKLGIGEVKAELLQLRDPVIREALQGSFRERGPGGMSLPALKEKARAICLSIVRLKVPDAKLGPSDLAFADDLAEDVASSARATGRTGNIRFSTYQVPRDTSTPPAEASVITEDAAKELRRQLEAADQVLLSTPVNERAISPTQRKTQLSSFLQSPVFQDIFAAAVKIPGAKPGVGDLSVLTKIVDSIVAKKPAPPAADAVPASEPIPSPPAANPPKPAAVVLTSPSATLVTGDAEKALQQFLKMRTMSF